MMFVRAANYLIIVGRVFRRISTACRNVSWYYKASIHSQLLAEKGDATCRLLRNAYALVDYVPRNDHDNTTSA